MGPIVFPLTMESSIKITRLLLTLAAIGPWNCF